MKIVLYNNGGSGNHGCEAIVRTTSKILNNFGFNNLVLMTLNKKEEEIYGLDKVLIVKNAKEKINKKSVGFIYAYFMNKIFGKYIFLDILPYKKKIKQFNSSDIAFAIGGDTYCYGYSDNNTYMHNLYKNQNMKTILWGCSIEPKVLTDKKVVNDLKNFDYIFTRECISYNALIEKGFKNAFLVCDSAFQLDKIDLPLPEHFIEGNTVGINVSPLIMSCETNKGITRENYIKLIEYIINETDMNVALIPHVVWDNNDDRKPLQELYDMFKHTNRVCLIEDHNCMELKGYISRCRFFVGARTHSTIAAYSTCVPTLVVGYSVKAKGIAKDIFGTYENYVLPVQSLKDQNDLIHAFKWMFDHEDSIRKHLVEFMPEYKERALIAGEKVRKLINK